MGAGLHPINVSLYHAVVRLKSLTLSCQEPVGIHVGHLDEAKNRLSGNHPSRLIAIPGSERDSQRFRKHRAAVFPIELLANLAHSLGESDLDPLPIRPARPVISRLDHDFASAVEQTSRL